MTGRGQSVSTGEGSPEWWARMAAAYRAMADGHTTRGPGDDFVAYCERRADNADHHATACSKTLAKEFP